MTISEGSPKDPHPERLTPNQEILADMLFETKQMAPVTRRMGESGNYKFEKVERLTSPIDFARENEFALKLHENQPDAPLSPVYINLRNLPGEVAGQVGFVMAELTMDTPADFCAGIPKAGIPLAEAYSRHSGIPIANAFAKEETGERRRIVSGGEELTGANLRLIDDLATGGETKLEAIKAAEELGAIVVDVVVLVDRQQGAKEQLGESGYKLKSAFTLDQLLRYGVRKGKITKVQYERVREYLGL